MKKNKVLNIMLILLIILSSAVVIFGIFFTKNTNLIAVSIGLLGSDIIFLSYLNKK